MSARSIFAVVLPAWLLCFAVLPAPSHAGNVWDGGSLVNSNWTTGANWNSDNQPPANNGSFTIVMGGTTRLTPNVNVAYDIHGLVFNFDAGGFTVDGEELTIGADGILQGDTQLQRVYTDIDVASSQTWDAFSGSLTIGNSGPGDSVTVNLGGIIPHTLNISGDFGTSIYGNITGFGTLRKFGAGMLVIGGAVDNTFIGATIVNSGTVLLQKLDNRVAIPTNLTIGDGTGSDVVIVGNPFPGHIANTSNVTINSSGLLNLNGSSETINNLTINGGSVSVGNGTLNVAATTFNGGSVTIGNGAAKFGGALSFTGAQITGTGTVEVYNTIVVNPSAQTSRIAGDFVNFVNTPVMNIPDGLATDDFEIVGLRAGHIDKTGPGQLVLHSVNTAGNVYLNGGPLVLRNSANVAHMFVTNSSATARFEASGHLSAGLHANAGKVEIVTGGNKVLVAKSLEIDTTDAFIDIWEHAVIVDYTGGSPLASIKSAIVTAYDNGSWNGFGITSSLADAAHGVGYGESSVLGVTSFEGESVDATSLLIKFTYSGDANLDGQVDITDLGKLATSWQTSGDWTSGDFDYSGFIDITDLGLLATNWQAGVGNPRGPSFADALAGFGLGGTSVPEPSLIGTILTSAWSLKRRGRTGRRA